MGKPEHICPAARAAAPSRRTTTRARRSPGASCQDRFARRPRSVTSTRVHNTLVAAYPPLGVKGQSATGAHAKLTARCRRRTGPLSLQSHGASRSLWSWAGPFTDDLTEGKRMEAPDPQAVEQPELHFGNHPLILRQRGHHRAEPLTVEQI